MAAALECWSGRPSIDEDMVEQVLMKTQDRSEAFPVTTSSSSTSPAPPIGPMPPKKWQRFGRNVAGAITAFKNSLNLDAVRGDPSTRSDRLFWGGVVRNLTQLYPGSQLPEKLISNIRRHFDSLPNSYAQADHEVKEVLLHVRLVEQALAEDHPALHIQEFPPENGATGEEAGGLVYRLTFASHTSISWPAMSGALDNSSMCCKKIQIFEKKGLTLGIVTILVQPGSEKLFKSRIEAVVRSAVKKPRNPVVKLPFGLCGCQEEEENAGGTRGEEEADEAADTEGVVPTFSPPKSSSLVVSVDEWQTVRLGRDEIGKWLLSPADQVEFLDKVGHSSFKGACRGKRVWINKLGGCERGNAYEVELRRDLLELMSCGHKNILQLIGIFIEESHGLCSVTRMMDGGSVHDVIQKSRKVPVREVMRIALDVAEGLMFMNDHGIAYRDLNTQKILLDKQGNACLGDMGVVSSCNNGGEVTEYETAGYRWLAPEIIAGDPENVTETWMSNSYSYGMVIWEMVTGEAAYSSYSPVQAAVGIAACGLRPEIPKDCPQVLRLLMMKCWNNCPSKRPQFSEIRAILLRQNLK